MIQKQVLNKTSGISRYRLRIKDQIISTLIPHFNNYPLAGYKSLQSSALFKIVCLLNDQVRSDQRDADLEKLIKELSDLK